ncbi:MAG: hypothetical protein WA101_00375, partial [Minisyncoccia bacterium]
AKETIIFPEKSFYALEAKYANGNLDEEKIVSYIKMRHSSCLSFEEEIEKYFQSLPERDYTKPVNWNLVKNLGANTNSQIFKFILKNRKVFYLLYNEDSVNKTIKDCFIREIQKCFSSAAPDTLRFKKLKTEFLSLNLPSSGKFVCETEISLYEKTENWEKYAKSVTDYVNHYLVKDGTEYFALNNFGWIFYEKVNDKDYLDTAILWLKTATRIHQDYFNTDTYGRLLFKRGKKAEAIKMLEKAIEIGKKNNDDVSQTDSFLKEIK